VEVVQQFRRQQALEGISLEWFVIHLSVETCQRIEMANEST
jgi:hypothetical protein